MIPQASLSKQSAPSSGPERAPAGAARDVLTSLDQCATKIRARRRQLLPLSTGQDAAVYIVDTGMALLESTIAETRRQILTLFFPGDVVHGALVPPVPAPVLAAAMPSELWRMPQAVFEARVKDDPQFADVLLHRVAEKQSRDILHIALIGSLDGEERVASFLIELALRVGTPCPNGVAFEIPLSRTEIADYLSLNPDTLSRIMSRLRAAGLVVQTGRGRLLLPDWKTLCASSPISEALVAAHKSEHWDESRL